MWASSAFNEYELAMANRVSTISHKKKTTAMKKVLIERHSQSTVILFFLIFFCVSSMLLVEHWISLPFCLSSKLRVCVAFNLQRAFCCLINKRRSFYNSPMDGNYIRLVRFKSEHRAARSHTFFGDLT